MKSQTLWWTGSGWRLLHHDEFNTIRQSGNKAKGRTCDLVRSSNSDFKIVSSFLRLAENVKFPNCCFDDLPINFNFYTQQFFFFSCWIEHVRRKMKNYHNYKQKLSNNLTCWVEKVMKMKNWERSLFILCVFCLFSLIWTLCNSKLSLNSNKS